METTGKVKLKRKPFEYILYDGSNFDAVQKFIGSAPIYKPNDDEADFMLGCHVGRMEWVSPGLFIVKDDLGHVSIYTRGMFERRFDPWDIRDDMATFVLCSHRTCGEDECFVCRLNIDELAHEVVTDFERKKRSELTKDDHVIRCVICHEPATTLDCHYPYEVEMNRCEKHQHSRIDPRAWSDYGVAVEVCKDHYGMLVLKAHIEKQLDWIMKQDMLLDENVLRDKLLDTLRHLDYYMNGKWPKEQMGPAKEEEAKTGK